MGIAIQTPPPAPALVAPQPGGGSTLVSVLPELYWSVSARGPLLVVGPERYTLVAEPKPMNFFGASGSMFFGMAELAAASGKKPTEPPTLDSAPREGWNPTVLAPRFGAQLVRVGGMTVWAPLLLPDTTKPNDPFSSPDMAELIQEGMAMGMGNSRLFPLLQSLSASQLTQATSSAGLPLSSLNREQRALLQPLLRRTLTFRFPAGTNLPPSAPGGQPPLIPQTDQNQFRLRLSRSLTVGPKFPDVTTRGAGAARMVMRMGNIAADAAKTTTRELALRGGKAPNPLAVLSLMGMGEQKGVPARKKPSELDPAAPFLNANVPLVGVKTVAELVARIAQTTKVPLYADQRIAKLTVSVRGTSARAGDLVQALCWAVGGAVRRISDNKESVYLLTEQVGLKEQANPLSAMMPAITGMMQNQKEAERRAVAARVRLIRQRTLEALPRGTGSELGESLWRIAEAKPGANGNEVPLGQLPPELQKRITESYNGMNRAISAIPENTPGFVKPEVAPLTHANCVQDVVAELVAPTLGGVATLTSADAGEIHPENPVPAPPPAAALPDSLKVRALWVELPETDAQSAALIAAATERGLTELRVPVPFGKEKALATLAAAAKGKVGVVAVLSPLEPTGESSPRDRSWLGQSFPEWFANPSSQKMVSELPPQLKPLMGRMLGQDYVTPEGADVPSFVQRVKAMLALPGVTGYGLERLAAPGYREARGAMSEGAMFFWQGGASPGERVAFVKDQSYDPAELGGFSFTDIFSGGGIRTAWTKRTTARSDAFLERLSSALTKAGLPACSVVASSEPPRWEKWNGKFPQSPALTVNLRPILKTLSYSRILAQAGSFGEASEYAGFDEPEQFAGVLAKELKELTNPEAETRWDGIVLDLSDQPLTAALGVLERAVAKK